MAFTSVKTCTSIGLMAFTLGKSVHHKLSHLVEKYSFGGWHIGFFSPRGPDVGLEKVRVSSQLTILKQYMFNMSRKIRQEKRQ